MRISARLVVLTTVLLVPMAGGAQSSADLAGHWEGSIVAPGMDVAVEIDVAKDGAGDFVGTFGQPAQHIAGLPLTGFRVDGHAVTFQVKGGAPGQRVFRGEIAADSQSMSGDFASLEFGTLPFKVTRTGDARIEPPAKLPAINQQLVGTWTGTLDVDGGIQLLLTLTNEPDGTAAGSLVSRSQGIEVPISAMTVSASNVTLEMKAVRGSYSGALNSDGTELVGTFTQGPASLPLTFRRLKAADK